DAPTARRQDGRGRRREGDRPPRVRPEPAEDPDAQGLSRREGAREGRRDARGLNASMCLGIPGEIIEIREDDGLRVGKVRFAGISREVCLDYVPDAVKGDFVVVHVGFAISKIDAEEAARSYRILEDLGQTSELTDDGGAPPEKPT